MILDMKIYRNLKFKEHMECILLKAGSKLTALARVTNNLPFSKMKLLIFCQSSIFLLATSISLVNLWFDPEQNVTSGFIFSSKATWVGYSRKKV